MRKAPVFLTVAVFTAVVAVAEARPAAGERRTFDCPDGGKIYQYGEYVDVTNDDGSETRWRIWIELADSQRVRGWWDGGSKPVWGHPEGKDQTELQCRGGNRRQGWISAHMHIDGKWRCSFHRAYIRFKPGQLWCERRDD